MRKFEKKQKWLSIRQKLMISYSVLVLIIFILGGAAVYSMYKIYGNGSMIYNNYFQAVDSLRYLSQNLSVIDRDVVLLMTDAGELEHSDYIYDILVLQTQNSHLLDDYGQLTEKDSEAYMQCRQRVEAYNQKISEILEQLESDDAAPDLEGLAALQKDVFRQLDGMITQSIQKADDINLENQRIFSRIIVTAVVVCLAAAVIAAAISIAISNYFTRRLDTIRSFAKRMAEYDISDDIKGVQEDEIGRTMIALNDSQFMIRDLIEKIISETSALSEMGLDISSALRKTGSRIQSVSMLVMQSGKMAEDMDKVISEILSERKLDDQTADMLRKLLPSSDAAREMLIEAMGEMSNITMQLEQIAVTSDYQNEIANSHKERIGRFKLQQNPLPDEPENSFPIAHNQEEQV